MDGALQYIAFNIQDSDDFANGFLQFWRREVRLRWSCWTMMNMGDVFVDGSPFCSVCNAALTHLRIPFMCYFYKKVRHFHASGNLRPTSYNIVHLLQGNDPRFGNGSLHQYWPIKNTPALLSRGVFTSIARNNELAMTYSHMGNPTLPSARRGFTSEFGKGSGGSLLLWSPAQLLWSSVVLTSELLTSEV